MSLTISHQPYKIGLARNPMAFEIQTTNLFKNHDIFPSIELQFVAKAKTGDSFSFDITNPDSGQVVRFVFKAAASVDTLGKFYLDESHVGTLQDYTSGVADQLALNAELTTYFTVEYDGNVKILLTAKEAVAELIPVNFSEVGLLSGSTPHNSVNETITTLFLSKSRRQNYRVLCDVFFEDTFGQEDWRKVASLKDEPDENGLAVFDLSSVLDAELKSSFTTPPNPTIENFGPVKSNLTRRYYISYAEDYEDQPVASDWYTIDPKYVHCGGVSDEDFTKNDPFVHLTIEKRFLTWQPNNKYLKVDQFDWLSWMNFTNKNDDFQVKIKLYYTDGTDSGDLNFGGTINVDPWEGLTMPVGYDQNDLGAIPAVGKIIYKWEYKIFDSLGFPVSEIRTYYLNNQYHKDERLILYLNAYCAPETFLTSGEWETSLKIQKQFANRGITYNYSLANGQEYQFDQSSKNNYVARTGFMKPEFSKALADMLINADVFLLEDFQFVPLLIEPGEFLIQSDNTYLNALSLKIKRSFKIGKHSSVTRRPTLTPILDCGLVGFKLDLNFNEASLISAMTIKKDGTVVYSGVTISSNTYTFPAIIKQDGEYQVLVDITLTSGEVFKFDIIYDLKHAQSFVEYNTDGAIQFFVKCKNGSSDTFYMDWGVSEPQTSTLVGNTLTAISKTMLHGGKKKGVLGVNCPSKVDQVSFNSMGISRLDISQFTDLDRIYILFESPDNKTLDISYFQKLTQVWANNCNFETINLGFHPLLATFKFQNNQLSADAIESILVQVWTYRKYYTTATKGLFLSGNPGSGASMNAKSLDIINGTGSYVNEGLASDYTFNVFY